MAETVSANAKSPKKPSQLLEGIASFLKLTSWTLMGLVFLFLGVICKIKRPIPAVWEPFFAHYIPHLPYFICGFGFLCLAHVRSILRKTYVAEQKKDVLFAHKWKISLLGNQVLLLNAAGLYAILYGFNIVPSIGMLGLMVFIAAFFLYLVLYIIEYFKNRMPSLASLRICILAFVLAALSFVLWTGLQLIIPSLVLAFLGIYASIYGLVYSGTEEQKGGFFKYCFVIATIAFLAPIGYDALDLWQPQTTPLDMVVAVKGLGGEIENLVYSPNGKQIAFNQKLEDQWYLRILGSDGQAPMTVSLPEVDDSFHSVFVDEGKSILIDAPTQGVRKLVKVDVATGTTSVLVQAGLEPFSGGMPWLDETQQFLFVTEGGKGFNLNTWTPGSARPVVVYSSPYQILSPAWMDKGEVVFVDGIHSTPYLLNLKNKTARAIILDESTKVEGALIEKDPLVEVLPSPDHFRYLFKGEKDRTTTLWTMLMDGTKRVELMKTTEQLSDLAWSADGQKVVLEKNGLQRGFKKDIKGVEVLDANLGISENLIPAQIVSHSPTVSPDGIKIAFVGSEGLWYPSLDSGIWVAVLR